MREILFRGKRTDNGEWVYGNYVKGCVEDFAYIVEFGNKELCRNYVEVIPETVGQYTGLCDKNGKKIFEGDIIREQYAEYMHEDFYIEYVKSCTCFHAIYIPTRQIKFSFYHGGGEVIGNIHDNPELLKEGAE